MSLASGPGRATNSRLSQDRVERALGSLGTAMSAHCSAAGADGAGDGGSGTGLRCEHDGDVQGFGAGAPGVSRATCSPARALPKWT